MSKYKQLPSLLLHYFGKHKFFHPLDRQLKHFLGDVQLNGVGFVFLSISTVKSSKERTVGHKQMLVH
jgi:hypothetical protein